MISMCCIDNMHLILGSYKHLIKLWTNSKYKTYSFYIEKKHCDHFVREYAAQKNVGLFKRCFRSISKHHKHMKASEAMIFIIYSLHLLKRCMNITYYKHHKMLVDNLTLLFTDSLTYSQLDSIESQLINYVLTFQVCSIGLYYINYN